MKSETSRFFRIGDTVYTRKGGKKGKVVALRDPELFWPACIGVRFGGWENNCFFRPDELAQCAERSFPSFTFSVDVLPPASVEPAKPRPLCLGDRVQSVLQIGFVDSGEMGTVVKYRPDGGFDVAFDSGPTYWCQPQEVKFVESAKPRPLCVGDRVQAVQTISLVDSGAEGVVVQRKPDGGIGVTFDNGPNYWCWPHELKFVAAAFEIGDRVWVKSTRCKGTVARIDPVCTTAPYAVRLDGIGVGFYSADSLTKAPKPFSWEDIELHIAGEPIPKGVFVCTGPVDPPAWAKPVLRALDHYDRHGNNAAAVFTEFAKLTPAQRATFK